MAQKPVLGKGLASLFPGIQGNLREGGVPSSQTDIVGTVGTAGALMAGSPTTVEQHEWSVNRDRHPGISLLSVDDIQVNPYQPRRDFEDSAIEELAQSIRANGIIQPLVVRKLPSGSYQLIAGERRMRAAKKAGLKQVPIVIRKSTDREALELALIENIQRQDLNCIDEALAYFQLVEEFQLTQEEVARQVGKDRATVANHLRLLRLPEAIIDDLKRQVLSFGHGKALLSLDDHELRLRVRAQAVERRLSVRDTEALIEEIKQNAAAPEIKPGSGEKHGEPDEVAHRLERASIDLTRQYSTKVKILGTERRGRIVVHYASRQELDRLLEAMQN